MWKYLTHPNIVPLLCVTFTPFQLISECMSGGELPDYIKMYPDADRLGLVGSLLLCLSHAYSRCQLSDVTKGLCYLHSCNVIHADLKGVRDHPKYIFTTLLTPGQKNILVDDSGIARIVDFGFTTVTQRPKSISSASHHHGHTVRWAAPEILDKERHSKEADIFSLAMVMIEVCHVLSTTYHV